MPKQVDKQGDTLFIKTHSNLTRSSSQLNLTSL